MTDTMIERMAMALAARRHQYQYDRGDSSLHPSDYAYRYWRDYAGDARAALTAMREPTEAMKAAAKSATYNRGYHDDEYEETFSAMIDAALAEVE